MGNLEWPEGLTPTEDFWLQCMDYIKADAKECNRRLFPRIGGASAIGAQSAKKNRLGLTKAEQRRVAWKKAVEVRAKARQKRVLRIIDLAGKGYTKKQVSVILGLSMQTTLKFINNHGLGELWEK